jgi:hypothetical protein
LVEIAQPAQFRLVSGHNEFTADFVSNVVCPAKLNHLLDPGHGQSRFGRASFVVKPTMQDAAVMGALVLARSGFLFQDSDASQGELPDRFIGGGQAHDTTANNGDTK